MLVRGRRFMGRPGKWWIGLLPLLALWLVMNNVETGRIERDLARRANASLAQTVGAAGFSTAQGLDLHLNGWIFDEKTRGAALAAAAALPGVRAVKDGLSAPLRRSPYVWRARLVNNALTLSGAVPTPAARLAIVVAAQKAAPKARIIDEMSYYSGAPPSFVGDAQGVLPTLARLVEGEVVLRNSDVAVSGRARTSAEYQAALAQLRALPGGARLAKADIAEPRTEPFIFKAESDGKMIALSGAAGSKAARAAVLAEAKRKFPDRKLADNLHIAPHAPRNFLLAAREGLGQLAKLRFGRLTLRDSRASLSGEAVSVAAADRERTDFVAAMPDGYAVETDISAPPPAAESKPAAPSPAARVGAPKPPAPSPAATAAASKPPAPSRAAQVAASEPTKLSPAAPAAASRSPKQLPAAPAAANSPKLSLPVASNPPKLSPPTPVASKPLKLSAAAPSAESKPDRLSLAPAPASRSPALSPPAPAASKSSELSLAGPAASKSPTLSPAAPPAASKSAALSPPGRAPLSAGDCREKMMALVRARPIQFAFASADIDPRSRAVLDDLVAIAKRCPSVKFEVAGHTDDIGLTSRNLLVSRERAAAVVAYLVAAGINPGRLTAVGYGETKPLVPNDSDENRAKNRRIEFNIK